MLAAQDRGALIFEAFSNSPPWFMTISGDPRYGLKSFVQLVSLQLGVWYWFECTAFF